MSSRQRAISKVRPGALVIGVNIGVRMLNCQVDEKKQTVASSSNGNGLKWLPKLDSNQRPAD